MPPTPGYQIVSIRRLCREVWAGRGCAPAAAGTSPARDTSRELASAIPRFRRLVGLDDRPDLTRNFVLNASTFVEIDMGNSRVFLHIDIR